MSWRWISLAALLAALVIGYGAFHQRGSSPAASNNAPTQPGYYLNDAIITETQKDGSIGIRLVAERIRQRPVDDSIVVDNVRVNYFQASGKEWILTAQRAMVPADSRIVRFSGDVELRPEDAPNAFLRTDVLAVDTERNIASGADAPAEVKFGRHTLTVQDFTADLNTEELRMESVSGAYSQ